jgi:hypothetical protein
MHNNNNKQVTTHKKWKKKKKKKPDKNESGYTSLEDIITHSEDVLHQDDVTNGVDEEDEEYHELQAQTHYDTWLETMDHSTADKGVLDFSRMKVYLAFKCAQGKVGWRIRATVDATGGPLQAFHIELCFANVLCPEFGQRKCRFEEEAYNQSTQGQGRRKHIVTFTSTDPQGPTMFVDRSFSDVRNRTGSLSWRIFKIHMIHPTQTWALMNFLWAQQTNKYKSYSRFDCICAGVVNMCRTIPVLGCICCPASVPNTFTQRELVPAKTGNPDAPFEFLRPMPVKDDWMCSEIIACALAYCGWLENFEKCNIHGMAELTPGQMGCIVSSHQCSEVKADDIIREHIKDAPSSRTRRIKTQEGADDEKDETPDGWT